MAALASVGSEAEREVALWQWLLTISCVSSGTPVDKAPTAPGVAAFKGCLQILEQGSPHLRVGCTGCQTFPPCCSLSLPQAGNDTMPLAFLDPTGASSRLMYCMVFLAE